MATPHIKAELGDFAGTVLMPGDPLRSEFIAKTFFDSPRLAYRDIQELIKEFPFQLWQVEWECLLWEYTHMSCLSFSVLKI